MFKVGVSDIDSSTSNICLNIENKAILFPSTGKTWAREVYHCVTVLATKADARVQISETIW